MEINVDTGMQEISRFYSSVRLLKFLVSEANSPVPLLCFARVFGTDPCILFTLIGGYKYLGISEMMTWMLAKS